MARVVLAQPQRVLGELGGERRRASVGCDSHSVVEDCSDFRVRPLRRQREMARPGERIVDDLGEPTVDIAPPVAEIGVHDGRQQRMRKADRFVLPLDHVRDEGRVESLRVDTGPLEDGCRRCPERRRKCERLSRPLGQADDPRAHELVERLRHGERLRWVGVHRESARQLQREERIAARALVDAEQRLTGEGLPEAVTQQPMERADAERSHRQSLDALATQRLLQR